MRIECNRRGRSLESGDEVDCVPASEAVESSGFWGTMVGLLRKLLDTNTDRPKIELPDEGVDAKQACF